MPGSHTGRRLIALEDVPSAAFTANAKDLGRSWKDVFGIRESSKGSLVLDKSLVQRYIIDRLQVKVSDSTLQKTTDTSSSGITTYSFYSDIQAAIADIVDKVDASTEQKQLMVPTLDWSGSVKLVPVPFEDDPQPKIFIIEVYGISSFLGDYGIGKTVRTFSLFPGETTNIHIKTWQSTTESIKESSSIIDSHSESAKERFSDKIQNETTDKSTESTMHTWSASASASASWGWGKASMKASASGEYKSGQESFAKAASESVSEHAKEASGKRDLTVTSSSEKTTTSTDETIIERQITNLNKRRTLNFLFKELNQEYITKLHLKDIRIAYSNGRSDSWREVSVAQLQQFLEDVVTEKYRETIARQILRLIATAVDKNDLPVDLLEKVYLENHGRSVRVEEVLPDSQGEYAVPFSNVFYRFKRGPLAQEAVADHPVDGVLISENKVVMRTDSVLVESLLGENDALDEFAMEVQNAAAREKSLANERETLLLTTLQEIADPLKRAEMAAQLFNPPLTRIIEKDV
ncbi:MAG: hypothetical protein JW739_04225 [Opitutales bacterium]|nr:hypothetical protein [Opitutales bacterium]